MTFQLVGQIVGWLVGWLIIVFYGILTLIGYLMSDQALSAGAVKYTDYISVESETPPQTTVQDMTSNNLMVRLQ